MKKAFITGISGFAGSHLADYLVSLKTYRVSGTYLTDSSLASIDHLRNEISTFQVNLLYEDVVLRTLQELKPDVVFHLAALSSPQTSFKNPKETITNNVAAQINLLDAVKQFVPHATVIIISSANVYGRVNASQLPMNEQTPLMPDNPYAISKITQDFIGLQYFFSYAIPVVRLRPFNHIGRGQTEDFVVSRFAKQIAEIEKGKCAPVLEVGNLSSKRDFTDVRDMVRAYELAARLCEKGDVYNIGTGVSHTIHEILKTLLSFVSVPVTVRTKEELLRPSDVPELRADATKFANKTGWKPSVPLTTTLREILDYWRQLV